jgi:hypothetical protein
MPNNKNLAVYGSTATFDKRISEHGVYVNTELMYESLHITLSILFDDLLKLHGMIDKDSTVEAFDKLIICIEDTRKVDERVLDLLDIYMKYGLLVEISPMRYEFINWHGSKYGENEDTLEINIKWFDVVASKVGK